MNAGWGDGGKFRGDPSVPYRADRTPYSRCCTMAARGLPCRNHRSLRRGDELCAARDIPLPPLPRAGSGAAHRDRRPHRCDRKRPWLATGSSTAAPAPATRSHAASSTALMTPIARHRRPGVTPNLTAISQRGSAMKLTISQRVCMAASRIAKPFSLLERGDQQSWEEGSSLRRRGQRDRLAGQLFLKSAVGRTSRTRARACRLPRDWTSPRSADTLWERARGRRRARPTDGQQRLSV